MMEDTILDFPEPKELPQKPAGFRLRAGAFVIDFVLLFLLHLAIGDHLAPFIGVDLNFKIFGLHFTAPYFVLSIPYFTLMESSARQATLGKMVMGLKVGNKKGQRIGMLNALGRCLGAYVSFLIFYIGYLMVIWTEHKQALHDKMADTFVYKASQEIQAGASA